MTDLTIIMLPRGLFDPSGQQHRQASLRPITGYFEVQMAEMKVPDAETVTRLLAYSVERIGGYDDISETHTAALSRGDRDFMLLHLRRSLFGDRLDLVVDCPNPSCRESADLELSVSTLAPEPTQPAPEVLEIKTTQGRATLREPTGTDDAAIAGLDSTLASALLWSRLILDLAGQGAISPEQWLGLAKGVRHAIALALAEGRSAPDLRFLAPCPSCQALMEVELDPAALLAAELGATADRLFAEVHLLAFHYHWTEEAILTMQRSRRWRYLELLKRQIEGQPLWRGI